jgi:XTP/dITP diphosphohydrolase
MRQLLLASNNRGKLRELGELLQGLDLEIVPQEQYGVPEVEETGLTFIENALLKARNAAHYSGLPALADDSGLVVNALHGAPGIHSARFAGPQASDAENLRKLLEDLACRGPQDRAARFQCVLVLLRHAADPMPIIAEGTWEGSILASPRGSNGFGYDPVFLVPGYGCSAAELPSETKNALSHRGQALRQFLAQLQRAPETLWTATG